MSAVAVLLTRPTHGLEIHVPPRHPHRTTKDPTALRSDPSSAQVGRCGGYEMGTREGLPARRPHSADPRSERSGRAASGAYGHQLGLLHAGRRPDPRHRAHAPRWGPPHGPGQPGEAERPDHDGTAPARHIQQVRDLRGADTSRCGHCRETWEIHNNRPRALTSLSAADVGGIERSWHKLHYLIAAHGGIPVDVIHGGAELPLEDGLGYGPARCLSSEDVVRASSCLAATPFDELARHYDLAAMGSAEIYLLPASEAEVPSDLDTLRHRYQELLRCRHRRRWRSPHADLTRLSACLT
ncbi:DUF1877 family protein [Streptomyces lavendulocolor]|uniref:DUF1877 family protein n=1 Tax=Streptomyces lavendulocolor TaxID=67316 RepID=A0ABV2W3U3_9ACTN